MTPTSGECDSQADRKLQGPMPTVEKEAPPPVRVTDRPGFKRFMHEWEEKLHHELATQDEQRERRRKPEHKKAA